MQEAQNLERNGYAAGDGASAGVLREPPCGATEDTAERLEANVPEELLRRLQWVCWRYEKRNGQKKRTKVPYDPVTGKKARTTDLMTWTTFDVAVSAYSEDGYDGVGFVFCSADPYVGIDLDDCRDPDTGEIEEWAQKIIDRFTDVVLLEASPSGRGVHLVTKGTCKDGINTKAVEVYGQDRFFTVTGAVL